MIIKSVQPDLLSVQFPYNPETIRRIKEIRGYRWDPQSKVWNLPACERTVNELRSRFPNAYWDPSAKKIEESAPQKKRVRIVDLEACSIPEKFPGMREDKPGLRNYQRVGVQFILENQRVLLADAMGVGKSLTSIASVVYAKKQSCLVVCQASNIETWNAEILKWTGLISLEINAKNRKKIEKLSVAALKEQVLKAKFVVTNYEMLGRLDFLKAFHWDAIIADEAHAFKTPSSIRSKNFRALKSNMLICATGTPIINRPIEMHNLLDIITQGGFGSYREFWERYCGGALKEVMIGAFCPDCGVRRKTIAPPCWKCNTDLLAERRFRMVPDYTKSTNMDELRERLTNGIMIARRRSDVLTELPEYQRINKLIRMTPEQKKQYDLLMHSLMDYLVQHKRKSVESAVKACFAEAMTRIGYARQHLAMCKADAAIDDAEEPLSQGDSVILFTNYKEVADHVRQQLNLRGYKAFLHTGDVSSSNRAILLEEFRKTPGSALVATIQSGGVGLNLQNANYSFFIDMPWTPAEVAQAEARTYRMGQEKSTFFFRYFIKGTYDEKLVNMLESKQDSFNYVMDGELSVATGGSDMLSGVLVDLMKELKGGKTAEEKDGD